MHAEKINIIIIIIIIVVFVVVVQNGPAFPQASFFAAAT
jgi:hypothetical protein